jgi:DNA polymerase III epsilon subunit-like protein
MIVFDMEMSGLDIAKCGIWQIGAIELENPANQFFQEARIDDDDIIYNEPNAKKTVFDVTGKNEGYFRDKNKQSQKKMLENFFEWIEGIKTKNLAGQNPWDIAFLNIRARKYGLKIPFHYRFFDLHSIAQLKFLEVNKKMYMKKGISNMGLGNILKFCGIAHERKIHNAMEDAKLTSECFSRILYGKNLLDDYAKFRVPDYLK